MEILRQPEPIQVWNARYLTKTPDPPRSSVETSSAPSVRSPTSWIAARTRLLSGCWPIRNWIGRSGLTERRLSRCHSHRQQHPGDNNRGLSAARSPRGLPVGPRTSGVAVGSRPGGADWVSCVRRSQRPRSADSRRRAVLRIRPGDSGRAGVLGVRDRRFTRQGLRGILFFRNRPTNRILTLLLA